MLLSQTSANEKRMSLCSVDLVIDRAAATARPGKILSPNRNSADKIDRRRTN